MQVLAEENAAEKKSLKKQLEISLMREEVKKIWPEIEWIQDPELKESVYKTWEHAIEQSVLTAEDLTKMGKYVNGFFGIKKLLKKKGMLQQLPQKDALEIVPFALLLDLKNFTTGQNGDLDHL